MRSITISFRTLAALGLAAVIGAGVAAQAANRPSSELGLLYLLNGEPESATQVTTATGSDVTASVTGGTVVELYCTTDSVFLPGTTVTTATGSAITSGQPKFVVLHKDTTSLAFRARTSAGTCNVSPYR